MKIKNLLMQWFVLTPLTLLQSACGWAIVSWILMIANDEPAPGSIFLPLVAFGFGLLISKLILKIKGKEVEYTYYDDEFEFEIKHDYGDKYSVHKTKGGWTSETKFIVWVYTFISLLLVIKLSELTFNIASEENSLILLFLLADDKYFHLHSRSLI